MTNWDTESAILRRNNDPDQNTYQVLAYDIRGLRFRYWYYDYNRGGWRFAKEWDSARETALMRANEVLFNQPAQNSSIEDEPGLDLKISLSMSQRICIRVLPDRA